MRHSKDSIDRFFDSNIHLETRTIWVGSVSVTETLEDESGTDSQMAELFIKGMHLLTTGPKAEENIRIVMNNIGGDWYHGMAMYDAIRACKAHVTIEGMGHVMSMGSIIMQAADARLLHPNCRVMVHDGSDGKHGHSRNFEAWGAESKLLRQEMYRIYAERSGLPIGYWSKKCVIDWVMSAEQAVREGLADAVLPPVKMFNKTRVLKKKKKTARK